MFLTLYRSLTRHRLYAILNIGGLALGIAVFLVLFLFVRFETGYDRVLPGWERVWTIERTIQFPGNPEMRIPSAPALAGQLQAAFPDLVVARMTPYDTATVLTGNTSTTQKLALVDPAYFRIFPFPVVEGDAAGTIARPDGLILTRSVAQAYFGRTSPLGRTLTVAIDGKPKLYRVGAVIADPPKNQTYGGDLFAALPAKPADDTQSASYGVTTFLWLPDAAAADRVARFIRRNPDPNFNADGRKFLREKVRPLASVHLADAGVGTVVAVLGTVGIVALLLAVVNYINLATARAGLRAREIALRKVVGATRRSLVTLLLGEALIAVTLAALIGLALAEIALPFVNAIGGTDLSILYLGAGSILPPLVVMIVTVALLAGFYPAFVISRFQPAGVLASARTPGGDLTGGRLRRALVVIQFGIAVALMIGTAVLVAQTRHMQQGDIGFGRDGLIIVGGYGDRALDPAQRAALLDAVHAIPGVTGVTTSRIAPTGGSFSIAKMQRPGATGEPPMIVQATIGDRFFETYRARLLAGRILAPARFALDVGNDDTGTKDPRRMMNVVLNRTAARRLGFDRPADAIDQTVSLDNGLVRIVGVIADMRFGTPREPVEALTYSYRPGGGYQSILVIRTSGDPGLALVRLENTWHRIAPAVPPVATTVDRKLYESFYRQDVQRSRLFTIGAVLAALIGCIGLYGLAAFDTARRVQEIGIRKVLGASTRDVLRLLLGQFLRPVLLANVIAWPIAWLAMARWLGGFDDRIVLSPIYFVAASVLALIIAAATVASQAWRVARAEPARALRAF